MENVQERCLVWLFSENKENRLPKLREPHKKKEPKSDPDFEFYVFTKELESFTFPQMIQSESNHLRSDDIN